MVRSEAVVRLSRGGVIHRFHRLRRLFYHDGGRPIPMAIGINSLQGLQRLTDGRLRRRRLRREGGRELGKMARMVKMAKVKGLAMLKKGAFYRRF